ncbi:MAG: MBL fold metallo-hydrolase [Candidatus Methanomethylophilaceae archaeon]|jgi:putative mRNA 3-end processing factor
MEMKFRFLGGAEMVGRMGMTMEGAGKTILIEYGMSPTKPPEYPLQAPRVDHTLLTHCHLDHCGMVPAICGRDKCELFTTPLSAEVGEIMMYDSLKIAKAENYPLPYTNGDIERTMKNVVPITFGDTIELGKIEVTMHSAGHIPGAAMFQFGVDTTTIYSGDIHTVRQRLVDGAKPVDCHNLFIEGTYGGRVHPDRKTVEKEFLDKIAEVVDRGGTVLIPSFAIGRTQEIMILLRNLGYEMWIDGMGRSVTRLYLDYPEYLADAKALKTAKRKFNEVRNANMRKDAGRAEVIVTTGGMLDGGPVLGYLKRLKDDPRNAVLLVGYQAEDTNGRLLMDSGCVMVEGEMIKINCEIQKFDFSAHADHPQLIQFIRDCNPENIIIMHSETRELFLDDLADYNVILPETGKEFTLDI